MCNIKEYMMKHPIRTSVNFGFGLITLSIILMCPSIPGAIFTIGVYIILAALVYTID